MCTRQRACGSSARTRGTGASRQPKRPPRRRPRRCCSPPPPQPAPRHTSWPPPQAACAGGPATAPGGAATLFLRRSRQQPGAQPAAQHTQHAPGCCCGGTMRMGTSRRVRPPPDAPAAGVCGRPHALGGRLSPAGGPDASAWKATTCTRPTWRSERRVSAKPKRDPPPDPLAQAHLVSVLVEHAEDEAHETHVQLLIRRLRAQVCHSRVPQVSSPCFLCVCAAQPPAQPPAQRACAHPRRMGGP
jgi:hypothetical protein